MKLSPALLAGSLAANVALAAALLLWSPGSPSSADSRATPGLSPAAQAAADASARANAARADAAKTWELLHTDDPAALVARLRAAGFPPEMVAVVVRELVEERFATRRRAITAANQKPFWQARTDSISDPGAQEALTALDREQNELMKQLLGANDPAIDEDHRALMRHFFGRDLAPEKLARIQAIQDRSTEAMSQLTAQAQAPNTSRPDLWARMQDIQKTMHADLAKVLTPDELFEFDLRNSNTSYGLRQELSAANPTEEEYRMLFPLYQALDAQFGQPMLSSTPEEMAPREAAFQQMQEQIKVLLGPDRYAAFQDAKNYDYQQTAKIAERLDLPPTATNQVYAVQKDIQQRATAVQNDHALSAADRTTQLAALATEADTKISSVIGAPGLDAYHQYAGQWLTQLQPRPARANSKSP
jgi:hypothetical protein